MNDMTEVKELLSGIPELDQYATLMRQIAVLQAQADDLRDVAIKRAGGIVKSLMDQHNLSLADFEKRQREAGERPTTEPRYRDPQSGRTWSGYGREPAWIKGRNREDFRLASH